MIDFQQKRQLNRIMYSKISYVILFIAVIFLGKATYNIYQKSKLSYDNYIGVKKDYDSLKGRKEMLESEIGRLKTDNGIEAEIRSRFNVAKPGETVVTIINNASDTTNIKNDFKAGFWSSFFGFFK